MIDFPSTPTNGQLLTLGDNKYIWNSATSQWKSYGVIDTFPAAVTFNSTATMPKMYVNRQSIAASGISWYSSSYTAWTDYMSQAGTGGCGPSGNITAPSGTFVTTWARRSFVENNSTYGWTWESGTSSQTTPTVVAELRASDGTFKNSGNIYSSGDIYSSYSDMRLKEVVGKIENPISVVRSIETFYYKPNALAKELGVTDSNVKVGVSAQSVAEVAPEVTAPSALNGEFLTVQYERLVPYLIESVKAQQEEIDQLKSLVGQLLNKQSCS